MTLAFSVTIVVDAIGAGCIASVTSGTVGVHVGLHDVELGTPVPIDVIGITVTKLIISVIDCRHQDRVQSSHTAAADLRQVHIVFERASKHVWSKVLGLVNVLLLSKVHSVVVVETELARSLN